MEEEKLFSIFSDTLSTLTWALNHAPFFAALAGVFSFGLKDILFENSNSFIEKLVITNKALLAQTSKLEVKLQELKDDLIYYQEIKKLENTLIIFNASLSSFQGVTADLSYEQLSKYLNTPNSFLGKLRYLTSHAHEGSLANIIHLLVQDSDLKYEPGKLDNYDSFTHFKRAVSKLFFLYTFINCYFIAQKYIISLENILANNSQPGNSNGVYTFMELRNNVEDWLDKIIKSGTIETLDSQVSYEINMTQAVIYRLINSISVQRKMFSKSTIKAAYVSWARMYEGAESYGKDAEKDVERAISYVKEKYMKRGMPQPYEYQPFMSFLIDNRNSDAERHYNIYYICHQQQISGNPDYDQFKAYEETELNKKYPNYPSIKVPDYYSGYEITNNIGFDKQDDKKTYILDNQFESYPERYKDSTDLRFTEVLNAFVRLFTRSFFQREDYNPGIKFEYMEELLDVNKAISELMKEKMDINFILYAYKLGMRKLGMYNDTIINQLQFLKGIYAPLIPPTPFTEPSATVSVLNKWTERFITSQYDSKIEQIDKQLRASLDSIRKDMVIPRPPSSFDKPIVIEDWRSHATNARSFWAEKNMQVSYAIAFLASYTYEAENEKKTIKVISKKAWMQENGNKKYVDIKTSHFPVLTNIAKPNLKYETVEKIFIFRQFKSKKYDTSYPARCIFEIPQPKFDEINKLIDTVSAYTAYEQPLSGPAERITIKEWQAKAGDEDSLWAQSNVKVRYGTAYANKAGESPIKWADWVMPEGKKAPVLMLPNLKNYKDEIIESVIIYRQFFYDGKEREIIKIKAVPFNPSLPDNYAQTLVDNVHYSKEKNIFEPKQKNKISFFWKQIESTDVPLALATDKEFETAIITAMPTPML